MRSIIDKWRIVFMVGLVLLLLSMFMDWYIYQIFNSDNELLASFSYSPFSGWSSNLKDDDPFNKILQPKDFSNELLPLNFLFMVLIFIGLYSGVFMNIENKIEIEKVRNYVYSNLFLLVVNMFYIVIFPVMFLIPNRMAFPLLTYEDSFFNQTIYYDYSVGPGYVMQAIAFICIFPYIMFCYVTLKNFQSEQNSPVKMIKRYAEKVQEPLDLDRLIAEENLKLQKPNQKKDVSSPIKKEKVKARLYD